MSDMKVEVGELSGLTQICIEIKTRKNICIAFKLINTILFSNKLS